MKWPPFTLYLKVHNPRNRVALWIPLFIIVPIGMVFLLALFLIALPFLLLSLLITWRWKWVKMAWYGIKGVLNVLHELPGLRIDIATKEQKVFLTFY